MADPTTPVGTQSFQGYPFPPDVLANVWVTILTGSPFANAITPLPSSSGRVAFPRAAPAGGAWVKELAPLPETNLHDDAYVVATAKLATILALSNESIDDASIPIGQLTGQAIADALGPIMDSGLLYGDGTAPNPDGVMNHAPAAAGGADFRAAVIEAAGELGDAGASMTTLVAFANPVVVAAEWSRTSTQGVPIHADAAAGALTIGPGIGVVSVPKIATSDVLVADVSQVYLVEREALVIETSPDYYFNSDALALRVKARVACAAPTPQKSLRKTTITP